MATILLVEDDAPLAALVADYLGRHGFEVSVEPSGRAAVARILAERPDLVLLDLGLPDQDGLSVCRQVRTDYAGTLVVFTARGDDVDKIVGLELGADAYVAKPVHPRLLLAKIQSLLLHRSRGLSGDRLELGGLVVDRASRRVTRRGQDVDLTSGEFDLIWLLASRAGQPVDRDTLYAELRGIAYDGADRAVDVLITRVRRKLPGRIRTVRAVGYLFARTEG
jgi:DNA-binding response OmpR family regulator